MERIILNLIVIFPDVVLTVATSAAIAVGVALLIEAFDRYLTRNSDEYDL